VLHFYSVSWDELLHLSVTWFCKLYNRIPIIQARQVMAWLPAIAYPHLTDQGRKEQYAGLRRLAAVNRLESVVGYKATDQLTIDRSWARLRGMGLPAPRNGGQNGN